MSKLSFKSYHLQQESFEAKSSFSTGESMKIWLDDERDPEEPIIQRDFGAKGDEIWAKTAFVAINYLKQGRVEFISLDHDFGDASAGTGMDVAKYIEEQAFHGTLERLMWAVHSMNPVGAKSVTQALTNADKFWDRKENPRI